MKDKPQANTSADSQFAALARRTFRIFVSSTFDDLERDALQQDVFPRLAELCRQSNVYLQPVDLRWGVSDAAVRDRQTMGICLREVDRCADLSPRVFYALIARSPALFVTEPGCPAFLQQHGSGYRRSTI